MRLGAAASKPGRLGVSIAMRSRGQPALQLSPRSREAAPCRRARAYLLRTISPTTNRAAVVPCTLQLVTVEEAFRTQVDLGRPPADLHQMQRGIEALSSSPSSLLPHVTRGPWPAPPCPVRLPHTRQASSTSSPPSDEVDLHISDDRRRELLLTRYRNTEPEPELRAPCSTSSPNSSAAPQKTLAAKQRASHPPLHPRLVKPSRVRLKDSIT